MIVFWSSIKARWELSRVVFGIAVVITGIPSQQGNQSHVHIGMYVAPYQISKHLYCCIVNMLGTLDFRRGVFISEVVLTMSVYMRVSGTMHSVLIKGRSSFQEWL